MVPIKIECDCGQRYAFDVEPLNGRMPSRVTCPTCGVDGTPAANDSISQHLALATAFAPAAPVIRMISPGNGAPPIQSIQAAAPAPIAPIAAISAPAPPTITPRLQTVAAAQPVPEAAVAPPALSVHLSSRPATTAVPTPRVDPRLGLVDRNQAEHEARAKAMWGDNEEQVTSYLRLQGFSLPEAQELAKSIFKERTSAVRANGMRKLFMGFGLMWVPLLAFVVCHMIGFYPVKLIGMSILVGVYGAYLFLRGLLMAIAPKSEKGDVADQ